MRKHELLALKEQEIKKKKKEIREKENYRKKVLDQNYEQEQREKERILDKIKEDEHKFERALQDREAYLTAKKEADKKKRMDKEK